MELILGILFWIILIVGIGRLFRWIGSASKATIKTISGEGDLLENFKDEFREMGDFEVRVVPKQIEISERWIDAYLVEVRGLIHAPRNEKLAIVTSIFDYTDQEYNVVVSSLDFFQEKTTTAFQNIIDAGEIAPNQGYKNWVCVARLFPETLMGVRSGARNIRVHVRAMPQSEVSKIKYGLHDKEAEIFCSHSVDLLINLDERGWLESQEQRDEARVLLVKLV